MVVTRALYKAASLPLRAAASAVNTSAAIVGGSVQFGTTATGAAVGAGMRLASAPARGMADLLSGLSEIHSLAGLAAEFVGAEPVRRSTRSGDRAWIEVRGLQHPQHGAAVADDVLTAVRAHPNVRAAQVNCPLSRVMVTRDGDAPSIQELCRIVADAERQHPGAATDERPLDLPGDSEVLAGRLVALAATSAGLAAALGGKALPWPRLPIGAAAAVTIVDYQPRVRRLLEQRFGHHRHRHRAGGCHRRGLHRHPSVGVACGGPAGAAVQGSRVAIRAESMGPPRTDPRRPRRLRRHPP